MKKKTKAIGFLITGAALAIGIAVSNGIIRDSYVADNGIIETRAATGNYVINFWNSTNLSDTSTSTEIDTSYVNGKSSAAITSVSSVTRAYQERKGGIGLGSSKTPAAGFTLNLPTNVTSAHVYAANWTGTEAPTLSVGGATAQTVSLGNSSITADTVIDDLTPYAYSFASTNAVVFSSATKRLVIYQIVLNPVSKTLQSITVSGTLARTSYYAGESFDPAGLTISANYDDESSADVTSECTFSPDPLTAGVTSVTASYTEGEVTETANIGGFSVSTRSVTSISVLTNPTKTSYTIGQSFDPAGMKIRAVYNVGPTNDDYVAYTYAPTSVFDSLGEKTITITSTENAGISTQLVVTVSEVSAGIYTIASNTTTYTDPLNPALLSISKSDSNLDNLTFSNISNVRLGASPNTSAIMIGANKTTGGSFTITLPTGLYAANVKFSGLSVGEDATTPTLKINNGVNFTYNGSNVETLKPYSNSLIISTLGTSRIWASSIEITAVLASTAALDFGTHFLAKTAAECSTLSVSQGTWNYVQSVYENAASAVQNIVKVADSDENGTDLEKAIARYTYIASKYGYADFMNLGISSSSNNANEIGENTHNVAIILIVSLVGASVLVGYRLMPKKKED